MKIVKPSYYKDFKCIAGECPDSCCQGWEVDADEESLNYYSTLSDSLEIKRRIDSVLDKDEFGNTIFRLAQKKRCPFLNSENLCDMHIAIGGEHTPFTCRTFPRFIYDFGGIREIGISFSCPVASEMMYSLERWEFEEEMNSDLPTLNDIDPVSYILVRRNREAVFKIIQNREYTVSERLIQLLDACDDAGWFDEKLKDSISFWDVFRNPELINPEWEARLDNACEKPIENSVANENIAMYFIYKYLLTSVIDDSLTPLMAVKMAVVGVLIHTYFGEDSWGIHLWSKETEHSQYNMDRYKRLLREAQCLSVESLKARISAGK